MKKIAVLFIALVASLSLFSQNSGKGFQYQAVARDANGNIRKNEVIEVRFSLVANSFDGVHHWIETHTVNTDPFGVFAVIIGKGLRDENSTYQEFSELNFRLTEYWLKIEIFDNTTWEELSNQQLLSVPYAENVTGDPAGTVNAFAGVFTPQLEAEGWLPCDGRIVSKDDYPELFNAIQEYWGNGDDGYYDEPTQAGGNFNLPDMRGMFLRGVDATAGNDPDVASRTANNGGNSGDNVGSHQADEFKTHTHKVGSQTTRGDSTSWQHQDIDLNSGDIRNCAASGGSETRPKNVYVNYIIKVR